jgi:hypothetical protein
MAHMMARAFRHGAGIGHSTHGFKNACVTSVPESDLRGKERIEYGLLKTEIRRPSH